jgi:hypothetical protein
VLACKSASTGGGFDARLANSCARIAPPCDARWPALRRGQRPEPRARDKKTRPRHRPTSIDSQHSLKKLSLTSAVDGGRHGGSSGARRAGERGGEAHAAAREKKEDTHAMGCAERVDKRRGRLDLKKKAQPFLSRQGEAFGRARPSPFRRHAHAGLTPAATTRHDFPVDPLFIFQQWRAASPVWSARRGRWHHGACFFGAARRVGWTRVNTSVVGRSEWGRWARAPGARANRVRESSLRKR